jgi:Reverse transcriptase (RNA-dependent DNA polymerase)
VKLSHWRQAMAQELDALAKNNTWKLISPPSDADAHVIGCKWILKVKRKVYDTIQCYKAHLVAKGYNQEECLNYFEIYSPIVKPTTIKVIITIALSHDWTLYADLEEIIYIQQPPHF